MCVCVCTDSVHTSIIFLTSQAGGASTEQALSGAVTSIQESLKSNDWATRKAASMALRGIAASGGPFLSSVKSSCILSLESCRFDKVSSFQRFLLAVRV